MPHDIPRIEEIHVDASVLLFALILMAASVLSGLPLAMSASRKDLVKPLHGGVAHTSPDLRSQDLLVVTEIALAFVVLFGAGLLLRSFLHLVEVDPGYEPEGVLTATVDLGSIKYSTRGRGEAFFDELLVRLGRHQKVKAAGVVSFPPLTTSFSLTSLQVEGQPSARTLAVPQLSSPGYLQAIGLRLVAGRWLTAQDDAAQAPVAVVNGSFVRRYLPGQEAIGRRMKLGPSSLEIVGVVGDVHLVGLDSDPKPELLPLIIKRGGFQVPAPGD